VKCESLETQEAAQTLICVASSFHWTSLLTPIIILLSVLVAMLGVWSARASTRQRATLDMIEKVESTPHYKTLHAVFSYHRRQDTFDRLHDPQEAKDSEERQAVLDYLNHYELVAIGVCREILDEAIYRDWMRGPFVRDWNAAARFIQRERWKWDEAARSWHYHDALFEHYQLVASRFSSKAIKLDKTTFTHPEAPHGPGDDPIPVDGQDDAGR